MSVPNTFATATTAIPLANLDANFAYYDAAFSISGTATTFLGGITLNTGTVNGVAYLNGSKVVTTGSALTFDGTNLNVGTGSVTTTGNFFTATTSGYFFAGAGTYTGGVYGSNSGNYANIKAPTDIVSIIGSTEGMRLTSTGLGIGTSSPLSKLTIQTQSVARLSARTTESVFGTVTGGSAWDSLNGSDSALAPFGLRGNGVYINDGTGTTTFSGGNLGLGVTPSAWGNGGNIQLSGANVFANIGITYGANAYYNGGWKYITTGYGASYQNQVSGQHQFFTSTGTGTAGNAITFTQAMTLDASGNLLVGSTSVVANANNFVYSPGNAWGIFGHVSGTASGIDFTKFYYNGAQIGSISQSGTTAVLYNLTSDQRLKTNIVDAAPASALIDAIQVRQYDWKSDGSHQRYGFIAQELVTVAPEAVHQPADPEEMMAVDYSKLVPMLVKEIQDLRKRLAAAGI